jgi:hypothetical protein
MGPIALLAGHIRSGGASKKLALPRVVGNTASIRIPVFPYPMGWQFGISLGHLQCRPARCEQREHNRNHKKR